MEVVCHSNSATECVHIRYSWPCQKVLVPDVRLEDKGEVQRSAMLSSHHLEQLSAQWNMRQEPEEF